MRSRVLTPFLALLVLACGAETADETATMDESQEYAVEDEGGAAALAEMVEYWETHANMGHAGMVMSTFTEDALAWGGDGSMTFGRETLETEMAAGMEEASPQYQFEQDEALVFGDYAVMRGTFTVTAEMDGESMTNSGYWTALAENIDGEWKAHGIVSNMDSEDQPLPPAAENEIPPAEESASLLADAAEYYTTHFNMEHAGMVAENSYTEDAVLMYSGAPMETGRAAAQAHMQELIDAGAQLTITPWSATELDADHIAGIGTFALEMEGATQEGHWAAVYRRGDDGTLRIHWLLSAVHPSAM